ncbi:glyoxalase superfamily protein [Saccharibacillus kuerlensis]|uniref:Bleomycin resistance protein n=1 Tax=Saccharibacillus kuerlensis TaxID=459527 RepID=A0ABQ2LAL4_9BACL|nr:glyoxalase superfamily protein [Saccharibacillus kuerlensis]GGO08248.1 bleomycin resistance protein [Saccharibacillus kuerlensis]
METIGVIPILRIFDEALAKQFYVDYLGFKIDWEHRFEADMPLYLQVSKGPITLHLSEHHGDCTPGSAIRIGTPDIRELHRELTAKPYRFLNPDVEQMPWGGLEVILIDPFGNRVIFYEPS